MKPAIILFIFFFAASSGGTDLLQRIQSNQYDAETREQIRKTEKLLDTSLNKELSKRTINWKAVRLDDQRYYQGQLAVSLKESWFSVESAEMKSESNLKQMIVNIELRAKRVLIQGSINARESITTSGTFRTLIKDVLCFGTGSVTPEDEIMRLEWLILDCSNNSTVTTEVTSSIPFTDSELTRNIAEEIGRRMRGEMLDCLTMLSRETLAAALHKTTVIYRPLARNQAYTKMTQMESINSNELLDAAISLITFVVQKKFNDSLPLPDIKEGCSLSLLRVLRLDTGIMASYGVAHDITTLERLGNARITQRNITIHFAGALIFKRLNIYYSRFRAAVLGLGPTGSLNVTVEPVGVALRMRLDFGKRRIFLDGFSIRKLGKTKVEIGGLGMIVGHILSELTQFFISILKSQIMKIIEQKVSEYARDTLSKNSIDDIFNGNITY